MKNRPELEKAIDQLGAVWSPSSTAWRALCATCKKAVPLEHDLSLELSKRSQYVENELPSWGGGIEPQVHDP